MKTIDPGLEAHLALGGTTLAACWRLTASDGTILGFTTASQDIVIDGITHLSIIGFTPTAVQSTLGLSVDNIDVTTALDTAGFNFTDIQRGKWDAATILIFLVNYKNLSQGKVILRKGRIGEIGTGRNKAHVEIRGIIEDYTKQILELYSAGCRADLGDTRCKVRLDPPAWQANTGYTAKLSGDANVGSVVKPTTQNGRHFVCTTAGTSGGTEPTWDTTIGNTTADGTAVWTAVQARTVTDTVTSVSSATQRIFKASARTEPNDTFLGGKLTWLTGNNAGQVLEIKRHKLVGGEGEFEVVLPTYVDIEVGDTFSVTMGCQKRLTEDCKNTFDNVMNYRGEPYVPHNFQISPARIDTNSGGK